MSRVLLPEDAPRRGARAARNAEPPPPPEAPGLTTRFVHWAFDNPAASGGGFVSLVMMAVILANAVANQHGRHPSPMFATRPTAAELAQPQRGDSASNEPVIPKPKPNQAEIALVTEVQQALKDRGLYTGTVDGVAGPATQDAIRAFERQVGLVSTGEPSDRLLAALRALAGRVRPATPQPAPASANQPGNGTRADAAGPSAQPVAAAPQPAPQAPPLARASAPAAGPAAAPAAATPASLARTAAPTTTGSVRANTDGLAPGGEPRVQMIQRALIATGYGPLKADGRMDAHTHEQIRRYEVAHGWKPTGEISDQLILDLLSTAVARQ